MKISKYLHSCILLEDNGKRLLIDPGAFSFIEGKLKPEDIGPVDAVLITHKHSDHCSPKALKYFSDQGAKIFAGIDIVEELEKENIPCGIIASPLSIDGFLIEAIEAPHEKIPVEVPHNLAYLINNAFLHPGDSVSLPEGVKCKVLGMPVAGPWLKLIDSLELARKLKPEVVIPIHDAIIRDFMLERIYQMCAGWLKKEGIEFKTLEIGQKIEL